MEEVWKDIKGYDGKYQVSNYGRVKSIARFEYKCGYRAFYKERILKQCVGTDGRMVVNLFKDGKGHSKNVHRLVAETFLENPNNLPQVNHIDEDYTNNNLNNLEWCTEKYNHNYGTRGKRQSEKVSKPVDRYTLDGKYIDTWKSAKKYMESMNIKNHYGRAIHQACNRYKGKEIAYGYKWNWHNSKMKFNNLKRYVYQYTMDDVYIGKYESVTDASIQTNCNRKIISKCCNGNRKSTGGYKWKYVIETK